MDLSIGGLVRQVVSPVSDLVSLVRTGSVEQIASHLRDNPDQRGAVETEMASGGRAGDLSAVVERASAGVARAVDQVATTVGRAAEGVLGRGADGTPTPAAGTGAPSRVPDAPAPGGPSPAVTASVAQGAAPALAQGTNAVARVADAAGGLLRTVIGGEAAARPGGPPGTTGTDASARPLPSAGTVATPTRVDASAAALLGRLAGEVPRSVADVGARTAGTDVPRPAGDPGARVGADGRLLPAAAAGARAGFGLVAALAEGRAALLVAAALRDGQMPALMAEAGALGRVPELLAATRTLDGAMAAFAAKGGPSATELALMTRAGLLSPADVQALRAAGVPLEAPAAEKPSARPGEEVLLPGAPRDAVAGERPDRARSADDAVAAVAGADALHARFAAGAVRIVSRAAVEAYGVLGPPGATVLAADAFEGALRAADGDRAAVERRLDLAPGVLSDPDTMVALVERRDLGELRPHENERGDARAPDPAGGDLPAARTDLPPATPYREMVLTRGPALDRPTATVPLPLEARSSTLVPVPVPR